MIIAFTGKAGVGKSLAIEVLKANSGGRAVCLTKFAAVLYQIQESIYRAIAPVYQRPTTFVKDRTLLQWLGTDWGRNTISTTLWVDLWKARVAQVRSKDSDLIVVCDDCRFENEAVTVKSLDGVIVKLTSSREGFVIGGIEGHASEAGLDPKYIDYTLDNSGTVEQFKSALVALYAQIQEDLTKPEPAFEPEEDDFMDMSAVQNKPTEQAVDTSATSNDFDLDESDFLPET